MDNTLVLKNREIIDETNVCSTYIDGDVIIEVENVFNDDISLEDAFFAALKKEAK